MKHTKKKVLACICLITLVLLLLTACGKQYTCSYCEKTFRGKAYDGFLADLTLCEDCAREYWAPFSYEGHIKQ